MCVGAAGLIGLEVFLHHPQSQFGEPHSTRPTSLVTRVVLTLPTNQTDERGTRTGWRSAAAVRCTVVSKKPTENKFTQSYFTSLSIKVSAYSHI